MFETSCDFILHHSVAFSFSFLFFSPDISIERIIKEREIFIRKVGLSNVSSIVLEEKVTGNENLRRKRRRQP